MAHEISLMSWPASLLVDCLPWVLKSSIISGDGLGRAEEKHARNPLTATDGALPKTKTKMGGWKQQQEVEEEGGWNERVKSVKKRLYTWISDASRYCQLENA